MEFLSILTKLINKMKITNNRIEGYVANIATQKICGCLLYGPNESLARMRFQIIAKKIVKDLSDGFLVSEITTEKIKEDKAVLADEFFSFSMLGGRKLIMIRDCDTNVLQPLKSMIGSNSFKLENENFLLMIAGNLDKNSALRKFIEDSQYFTAIPCYEDDEIIIKKFIKERLEKNYIQFDNQIIELLLARFGKNRQILNSEIEKISIYLGAVLNQHQQNREAFNLKRSHDEKHAQTVDLENSNLENDRKITTDLLNKIYGSSEDDFLGDFVTDFADKNYVRSIIGAEKLLLQKEGEVSLIRFLITYFLKLYAAKTMIENGNKSLEDATKAQQIFFKIEHNFKKNLREYSLNSIAMHLKKFEECEREIKRGNLSSKNSFLWSILQSIF